MCSRRLFLAGIAGFGATSCASNSTYGLLSGSFRSHVQGTNQYPMSAEQIHDLPYATLGVRVGSKALAVMVLSTISGDELTWASADHIIFVTRKGRLVRTTGLPRNLSQTHWQAPDPLETAITDADPPREAVYRDIDLKPDPESAVACKSLIEPRGAETIVIQGREHDTRRFDEHVVVPQWRWETRNSFWVGVDDGRVWRSVQKYCPEVPPILLEILKPAAV